MRTDAKIGFAIGGVLLAVLTVYAIVVPKHNSKKTGTVAVVTTPTGADTPAPTPLIGTPDNSTGNTQPPVAPLKDNNTGHDQPPLVSNGTGPLVMGHEPGPNLTKPDDSKPLVDPKMFADPKPFKPTDGNHTRPEKLIKPAPYEVADSDRVYTIKPGQTLSKIAYEVFGNARFFVAIQRENPGLDPTHLKPGTKIKLPDITPPEVISDERSVLPPDGVILPTHTVSTHTGSSNTGPMVASSDGHSYTVKSGDNLYAIARKLLGSGKKADALYELNKDVIGPDKSRLKLGMVLKLPEAARTASVQ